MDNDDGSIIYLLQFSGFTASCTLGSLPAKVIALRRLSEVSVWDVAARPSLTYETRLLAIAYYTHSVEALNLADAER